MIKAASTQHNSIMTSETQASAMSHPSDTDSSHMLLDVRSVASASTAVRTCAGAIPSMGRRRCRLPWLDGNVNSSEMPGAFDAGANPSFFATSPPEVGQSDPHGLIDDALEHKEGDLSLPSSQQSEVVQPRPTQRPKSRPLLAGLESATVDQPRIPGHWPTTNAVILDPPLINDESLPGQVGTPYDLAKGDTESSRRLSTKQGRDQVMPTKALGKPSIWPMVPLSETDVPMRMSSLAFSEPAKRHSSLRSSQSARELSSGSSPSSIGRYTDGTISRKPTVRASSVQARLDRSAIAGQIRSADVSPKSSVPPTMVPPNARAPTVRSDSMQRAVNGLHDLMHEALFVATEAAQANQTHEVAQILNEATLALRKANTVQDNMNMPLKSYGMEASASSSDDYTSGSDSEAYIESDTSSIGSLRQVSRRDMPSEYANSRGAITGGPGFVPSTTATTFVSSTGTNNTDQLGTGRLHSGVVRSPTVIPAFLNNGKRPTSRRGLSESQKMAVSSSDDKSIVDTPLTMYRQPSRKSAVTDWAYVKRVPGRRGLREDSKNAESANHSSVDVASVAVPAPIRVPTEDHTRFLTRDNTIVGSVPTVEPMSLPEIPRRRTTRQPISNGLTHDLSTVPAASQDHGSIQRISYRENNRRHVPHIRASGIFDSPHSKLPDKGRDILEDSGGVGNRYGQFAQDLSLNMSLRHPRRNHISLSDDQMFRLHRYRRQPIAREWSTTRKRVTAGIACLNTALVGLTAGIYAGEVPKIQYQLADMQHRVILGNVLFYICLGLSTMFAWPLPLLHGRKPYTLAALAIALPLNFPQAIMVGSHRSPRTQYYVGLLLPRAFMGLALGFANVNFITTLLDLFGASLQSTNPHQEIVVMDDVRRQGGGMGLWLGLWAWCFVGSLSAGFLIGAAVTASLNPAWGFYVVVIIIAVFMLMNVIAPEPRRAAYRRSVLKYLDEDDRVRRRVARGEVKLHISMDGPKYWWEEAFAGIELMGRMMLQPGSFVLSLYLAWIYALVVLVTLLLGALLSRDYRWHPGHIGLAVFAVAIGAAMAVPLTKANILSRDRAHPARTDSMTFQPRVTWTSHLVRRCIFTFTLPIAGVGFCLASPGPSMSWVAPTILSGLVGFLSCLAVAECIGLMMETFDTSDLQPGVNTKHRLQSMESATRRRRTNYSSFPRVTAAIFTAQAVGFFLAAVMTAISGTVTRDIGAQAAIGVVAGVLLVFTILLSVVLWRFRSIQVIPNHALGTARSSHDWQVKEAEHDPYFKPVIIGNPSGKVRRMNLLETGAWSRWTEIRKLNKLIKHKK
ncbi:hypothetical protein AAFC00_003119 [Neodothiora populina]|uniref:Polyamine transport protein n=1 Tax=Neodothiora populina TaxID=2781224 RepID=A0ABR3P9C9_9PEZI